MVTLLQLAWYETEREIAVHQDKEAEVGRVTEDTAQTEAEVIPEVEADRNPVPQVPEGTARIETLRSQWQVTLVNPDPLPDSKSRSDTVPPARFSVSRVSQTQEQLSH